MQLSNISKVKPKAQKAPSTLRRVGAYAAVRILTIAITIVVGIFFTVIVANKNNGLDISLSQELFQLARREIFSTHDTSNLSFQETQELIDQRQGELEEEAGLYDPFLIKHLRLTWNALRLKLGEGVYTRVRATYTVEQDRDQINKVILDRLPNTLVIIGLADLLVFVVGIPLALYLSRNYGGWFDKVVNMLSPLSSVPSWVHGVLLILIFSVTFKLLPPGSMIDIPMPETRQDILLSRAKHMILPVTAIFLSLLFQLVYSWRNYFMIYSNEDYVEFATAMGLSQTKIQNKYILRPSLPYVLTSFALTLVSFWQMATALEIVFNWDGIGKLYIISLPNFWGESMFPGEMGLTIGIVVLFAYILGMVVLLLDIAYALVDPRIRLGGIREQVKATRAPKGKALKDRLKALFTSGQASTAKILTLAIALVVVGVLAGLIFGWQVWPVQVAQAEPADMHQNFQLDYLALVVDSFSQNEDSALARQRLDALDMDRDNIFGELLDLHSDDPAFQERINFFSTNYDPLVPPPTAQSTDEPLPSIFQPTPDRVKWLVILTITSGTLLAGTALFYFLVVQRRGQISSKRLALLSSLALVMGVLLGIFFAGYIWPVEYANAAPAHLEENYQIDYLCMVIDSFNITGDSALARTRLDALGEEATPSLQFVLNNQDLVAANAPAIYNFVETFDTEAPGATIASVPESTAEAADEEQANNALQIGSLQLPPMLAAGGVVGLLALVAAITAVVQNKNRRDHSPTYRKRTLSDRLDEWQKRMRSAGRIIKEISQYKSAVAGMIILSLMIIGSLYAVIAYPYNEVGMSWYTDASENSAYIPKTAKPVWVNWFRRNDLPETIVINSTQSPDTKEVEILESGNKDITFTFTIDYPYKEFPNEGILYFDTKFTSKKPFATLTWFTPDGRDFELDNYGIVPNKYYNLEENIDMRDLESHQVRYKYSDNDSFSEPLLNGLFMDPDSETPVAIPGQYKLVVQVLTFEPDTEVDMELVLMGKIYGAAGTDFMRRDLVVPLLWGMPFALVIGLVGALLTTIVSMLFAAFGVWYGGWADNLVQRVTEANMILPVVAIAVLFYAFFGASLWTILTIIVILNAFGSPTKTFRAAFIQVKQSSYIEAAQAYGAPNRRIIFRYMIPRILPVLIPQLVMLVPGFIFLEATLGMFNVKSVLPTWGKVIYEALSHGAAWGSRFWVLEPIALLLLTGFAFSMMGFALDRVLNPRLQNLD